jgi:hypothetical protein
MTNRIPQNRIEQIEAILSRLEALADVRPDDDPGRAERVGVRTYVESWITDDVRSLLDWARGETTR